MLKIDGVKLHEDYFLVTSLTKACKLTNDRVHVRLPIHKGLLAIIVKQTKQHFENSSNNQPFLLTLYQTIFTVAYYGLFRVGELTAGVHPILARDIHIGFNKQKLLFILRSSKTHAESNEPQSIKICSVHKDRNKTKIVRGVNHPCPYELMRVYGAMRGTYTENEQFFIFSDHSQVTPNHLRRILEIVLGEAGLDPSLYSGHSFRISQ